MLSNEKTDGPEEHELNARRYPATFIFFGDTHSCIFSPHGVDVDEIDSIEMLVGKTLNRVFPLSFKTLKYKPQVALIKGAQGACE